MNLIEKNANSPDHSHAWGSNPNNVESMARNHIVFSPEHVALHTRHLYE